MSEYVWVVEDRLGMRHLWRIDAGQVADNLDELNRLGGNLLALSQLPADPIRVRAEIAILKADYDVD